MTTTIALAQWQSLNGNHVGITSLEDLASAWVTEEQNEVSSQFRRGDLLIEATEAGIALPDAIRHCASLSRRTIRGVRNYWQVSSTFSMHERNEELPWSFHLLCTQTTAPHDWLDFAAREYVDENGELQQHSYRTLKEAIQASGGKVEKAKLHYLIEAAPAFMRMADNGYLAIRLEDHYPVTEALRTGIHVKVWIAISSDADESNEESE